MKEAVIWRLNAVLSGISAVDMKELKWVCHQSVLLLFYGHSGVIWYSQRVPMKSHRSDWSDDEKMLQSGDTNIHIQTRKSRRFKRTYPQTVSEAFEHKKTFRLVSLWGKHIDRLNSQCLIHKTSYTAVSFLTLTALYALRTSAWLHTPHLEWHSSDKKPRCCSYTGTGLCALLKGNRLIITTVSLRFPGAPVFELETLLGPREITGKRNPETKMNL